MRRSWERAAVLVLLGVFPGAPVCPSGTAGADQRALPGLEFLNPGIRVGPDLPEGWSHLVIKSLPRIESGDLDTLPSFATATAALFRTVILADVRPGAANPLRYRLERVGLALCAPVKGVDTVVSTETDAPPYLGFLERQVCVRAQAELRKARLIARTETFAVLGAPSRLSVGGVHENVTLAYAFLVDPVSGRLDTILWSVPTGVGRPACPSTVVHLPPDFTTVCGLDVSALRLLGTFPVEWSFALRNLPSGIPISVPSALRSWLPDLDRLASHPRAFEGIIRKDLPLHSR